LYTALNLPMSLSVTGLHHNTPPASSSLLPHYHPYHAHALLRRHLLAPPTPASSASARFTLTTRNSVTKLSSWVPRSATRAKSWRLRAATV
jgi:hypothetical protein